MDKRFYPYVARRGVLPKGRTNKVVLIEKLNEHIPPGEYYFCGMASHQVNFMKVKETPIRTNVFSVAPAKK